MRYAINHNCILPIRAESSEKSEMVTQLIFGEYCKVFESEKSFVKIENHLDGYTGWVDKKMLTEISEDEYQSLINQPLFRTCVPVSTAFCLNDKSIYHLTAGSLLPNFDIDTNTFGFENKKFQIHPSFVTHLFDQNKNGITTTAQTMLNAPYLWGGKSIMGIDCSGFVQIVYSINGFQLPRDASMQALCGCDIRFDDIESGDLLFFEKENRITHVGIYMGDNKIIHASGRVKIDRLDSNGIYSEENSVYTHSLALIRRI